MKMDNVRLATETETLKAKLKATWAAGDFGEIARSIEVGAAEFVAGLALTPGTKVLDVACGNGNTAIPAVKAGALVTGIDLAPYLVAQATTRAREAGIEATFEVGAAEALPYGNSSFDAVITMFGAMFAPRPDVVASELKRVCSSGGLIAMANWHPAGFVGQMFKTTGKHVQPPASMPSPLLWGDEATVRERFSTGVAALRMEPREIDFDQLSQLVQRVFEINCRCVVLSDLSLSRTRDRHALRTYHVADAIVDRGWRVDIALSRRTITTERAQDFVRSSIQCCRIVL
jgi:SAM-dependent methyltransferase